MIAAMRRRAGINPGMVARPRPRAAVMRRMVALLRARSAAMRRMAALLRARAAARYRAPRWPGPEHERVVLARRLSATDGGTLTLNLETAPLKDETLFTAMVGQAGSCAIPVTAAFMTPKIFPVVLIQTSSTVPLARYVRWHVSASGSFSAAWDMTFRVLVAANQIFTFNPTFNTQ